MSKTGFEHVDELYRVGEKAPALPIRGTKDSAGYDFFSPISFTLQPGAVCKFRTNVKVKLESFQELQLRVRSSLGKLGADLLTDTIDSDYYDNKETGGNIVIQLYLRPYFDPITIRRGDRIVQGVVQEYCILDNDSYLQDNREGGFGHTGR